MKGSLAVSSSRISHCCQIFMQASRPGTPAMPGTPSLLCQRQAAAADGGKMVPRANAKTEKKGPRSTCRPKAAEVNRDEVNRDDHRDKGGWAQ